MNARTTARSGQLPPSEPPEPEDPAEKAEREAARFLSLAANVEESATAAKAERRAKDAQRLFDSAERRYAEIVQKFPQTNAASEARKAIKRLQGR